MQIKAHIINQHNKQPKQSYKANTKKTQHIATNKQNSKQSKS